jgi:hypothetical protein
MVEVSVPTRNQIARLANNDPELVKALERLFIVAGELTPADIVALTILIENAAFDAGSAQNKAEVAIADAIAAQSQADAAKRLADLLAVAPIGDAQTSVVTDYVDLNIGAPHEHRTGRISWHDDEHTAEIGMEYGVVQQVGMETYALVENNTGVTIPNGTVVGFAGVGAGGALSVAPYLADGSQPSLYILGVMTHDLPDTGTQGYCTSWGYVRDLNTSSFSVGDLLYPSPTVAGAFTNVKPTAPNNVIPIAACLVSDASDGVVFVRPTIEQMQYYGVFSKTTDATPAATNTAYTLTFDNTDISNGVTIGTPTSRIVVPASGLYQLEARVQISSGNSSKKDVYVWFKKNGTDVPNTTRIVTSDVSNGYVTVALTETISLAASDYIEMAYAATNTNVTIDSVAATAFSPAAPAIILTVTQVQQ